ncbi:50S ribosomal protein L11 [bacterium]|nr:50S ribosomal protein L11 [bacterium]MBU1025668.1 50S ribosomal protein L11 [bacterium]
MATKKITKIVRLQIVAGKASPGPPVGPVLGQHGINIPQFCKMYNDATKEQMGSIIPVEISVFEDKTFEITLKSPPVSALLKNAAKIEKGSGNPLQKIGKVSRAQVVEIAKIKMQDLNAYDIDAACNIVMGTARSMGIVVEG